MLQGVIVKTYNSYYYVQIADKVIMCTLRGRFKKERFSLLVGDQVLINMTGNEKGIVEQILPRNTMLKRPMVANVDQVILTFAAVNPDLNPKLVDRFLVLAELSGLRVIICINKMDLADSSELHSIVQLYKNIGYPVLLVSAKHNIGIADLKSELYDRITVFAGPSGAGKSTLLNVLEPGLQLVTGEVSEKIGRGKHTTRFAQLMALAGGGFVVDTPGFSFTEFRDIPELDIMHCYIEIARVAPQCKFNTCLHLREPQCAVKQAVLDGTIARERYDSYAEIVNEIKEMKKGY